MNFRTARMVALVTLVLGIITIGLLLSGRLDPWAWPTTLLVMVVVCGQSSLLLTTPCPQCGKSPFVAVGHSAVVGEAPSTGRRLLLPERECSACHRRNDRG